MDYATRLLDERRLGFKEGYEKGKREVRKEMAQNLTVEEMNELLKQV